MKPEIQLTGSDWFVKLKVSHDFGLSSADLIFHNDGGKFTFRMMESDARDLANFILENTND